MQGMTYDVYLRAGKPELPRLQNGLSPPCASSQIWSGRIPQSTSLGRQGQAVHYRKETLKKEKKSAYKNDCHEVPMI